MLTQDFINALADMAGDDFSWPVSGTSKPSGGVKPMLRDDLLARAGGICAVCGESGTARGAWEINHVVSRGPAIKGFTIGNLFAGHSSCNALTKPIYVDGALVSGVEVLPLSHFARPDVVPMEWTPFPILRAMAKAAR